MLRVDKACNPTPLLNLGHHMQGNRGLSAGFRAVNLDNPAFRHTAQPQGNIQAQTACGNRLHIHGNGGIAQLHNRSLAKILFNLADGRLQGL